MSVISAEYDVVSTLILNVAYFTENIQIIKTD